MANLSIFVGVGPECGTCMVAYIKMKLTLHSLSEMYMGGQEILGVILSDHPWLKGIKCPINWGPDPGQFFEEAIQAFIKEELGETKYRRTFFCKERHDDDWENEFPGPNEPGPSRGFKHCMPSSRPRNIW